MRAGKSGRVAIKWDQTEIDGLEAAPQSFLRVGAAWSWRGQARFLAQEMMGTIDDRPISAVPTLGQNMQDQIALDAASGVVVLTNGAQSFTAFLLQASGALDPVLVFEGDLPARDQDFWISEYTEAEAQNGDVAALGDTVVAFPPRPVADLGEHDQRRLVSAGHGAD